MRNLPKTLGAHAPADEATADVDETAEEVMLISRADGYYWVAPDGQEIGPFDSREQALADVPNADEDTPEPGESLQEAEDEIGIADWIDPDTGEPAEGQSSPRRYSE